MVPGVKSMDGFHGGGGDVEFPMGWSWGRVRRCFPWDVSLGGVDGRGSRIWLGLSMVEGWLVSSLVWWVLFCVGVVLLVGLECVFPWWGGFPFGLGFGIWDLGFGLWWGVGVYNFWFVACVGCVGWGVCGMGEMVRICPFCGHHGQELVEAFSVGGRPGGWVVRCRCCGAVGPVELESGWAVASWNFRHVVPAHGDDGLMVELGGVLGGV